MTVLVDEVYGRGMIRSNETARREIDQTALLAERRAVAKTQPGQQKSRESAKLAVALRMATRRHPKVLKG